MTVQSKLTAQGQISVPAEVRRKLGIGPGSVIVWEEQGEEFVVRRAGRFSSLDIHHELFSGKRRVSADPKDTKEGIRKYIRRRHARR